MKVPIRSNIIKTYASSAASKKAGEGVPYETILKGGVTPEQTLPEEADVVVLGKDLLSSLFCLIAPICYSQVVVVLVAIHCTT